MTFTIVWLLIIAIVPLKRSIYSNMSTIMNVLKGSKSRENMKTFPILPAGIIIIYNYIEIINDYLLIR